MLMTTASVISARSAAFGYADRAIVTDASFDIHRGDVVAMLGPNGSGKTTLVKGLLGLNDHLRGEVQLFGTPLAEFREHPRIGYVPQRHSLSTSVRATVAEVVSIGRLAHRRLWSPSRRGDAVIVATALDLVGLADRAHEDVSTLSGGQQRRVLIARALAAQPDVLVMDEPTAGVDAASQQVLAAVLQRLAARGTTMLIATHELAALRDVVTRVICTRNGRIDFNGPLAAYPGHQEHGEAHSHHHDDELSRPVEALPGAPVTGPLDTLSRRPRD
jgi:zinc transport system ATP-binding protein